jgi:catechol 2,3-dioxygenase-like lactoylglutathione lyase family enzyme
MHVNSKVMKRTNRDEPRPVAKETAAKVPSLGGVLETVLYFEDLNTAEDFYGSVLGLKKVFAVPKRQLVFQCNNHFVLLFNPSETERNQIKINGGLIPLHGARGAGHLAFCATRKQLPAWRRKLSEAGVPIESEIAWPNGAHSIYFRDPAGNSLELATPDMWKASKD